MKKLLVICGPTATGKTALAAHLAKSVFGGQGEIISADSRQVYKGMNIITGKDRPKGVKIHLLDVVRPNEDFSAAQFYQLAWRIINKLWSENKLPIIVGGTGFYIKTLLGEVETKNIPPNPKIRQGMNEWDRGKLFDYLQNLDPLKAASLNKSDRHNPRRLIRAIEIAVWRQENPTPRAVKAKKPADCLFIGLKTDFKTLYRKIDGRTSKMVKEGAEKEIAKLIARGYTWHNSILGVTIGYREWEDFFQKKASREQVIKRWQFSEHAYARRQMTWFKKALSLSKGKWFDITNKNWQDEVEALVKKWYYNGYAAKN
jgi:tRNA dimethylallyltransferase